MSRSGYSDDVDDWDLIRWRGAVLAAVKGKRGQAFLLEMRAALDAMPVKRLIAHELKSATGEVCALGCVGVRRGIPMPELDPEDDYENSGMGELFGIAEAMAKEIQYVNDDEGRYDETPEERWSRVSRWVDGNLKSAAPDSRP